MFFTFTWLYIWNRQSFGIFSPHYLYNLINRPIEKQFFGYNNVLVNHIDKLPKLMPNSCIDVITKRNWVWSTLHSSPDVNHFVRIYVTVKLLHCWKFPRALFKVSLRPRKIEKNTAYTLPSFSRGSIFFLTKVFATCWINNESWHNITP